MDIFIDIKCDSVVQVGERIRFDLTRSFVPKPNNTANDVERIYIDPRNDGNVILFHDSSSPATKVAPKDWVFDWVYTELGDLTDGKVEFSVTFYTNDASNMTKNAYVTLLTEADDALFSNDEDLIVYENDILKLLPEGRSTWNYVHRRSQERI